MFFGQVDLMECGTLAANQLDAIESNFGRVVKAVDNNNVVTSLEKGQRCKRANVARATTPITALASWPKDICLIGLTT